MTTIHTNLPQETAATLPVGAAIALWRADCELFLSALPKQPLFDLIVTSPPYLVGKEYERKMGLDDYVAWQRRIFVACLERLKPTGSICWQIGTHVTGTARKTSLIPLDLLLHPVFTTTGAILRNRIVWHFGHGLHATYRFSGRHETILWYSAGNDYYFNLDAVRVPQKYPGKRSHRQGPQYGTYSGHILGKNPSDLWADIPNVKGRHQEKSNHPCQFPVALAERLIRSLSPTGGLIFDPFAGVASTGVAAIRTGRRFWGCEIKRPYVMTGLGRLAKAQKGTLAVRPLGLPIFDHTKASADLRHRVHA